MKKAQELLATKDRRYREDGAYCSDCQDRRGKAKKRVIRKRIIEPAFSSPSKT